MGRKRNGVFSMSFYYTDMEFLNGMHFVDFWVNQDDAYNYWDAHKEKCKRAAVFEMKPDEENFQFEAICLGECDIDGHYYFKVNEQ